MKHFEQLSSEFGKQEAEAEGRPASGSYLQSRDGSTQVWDWEGKLTGAECSFYCGCAAEGAVCVSVSVTAWVCVDKAQHTQWV